MTRAPQESAVPDTPHPATRPLTLRRRLQLAYPTSARIAALTYALYALLAFAVYAYSKRSGSDVSLCTFKRVTGHPCATCGGTRAAVRLANLDLAGAIEYNPFATALLVGFAAWFVIAFIRAGRPLVRWTQRRRIAAGVIVLGALVANWAYVWKAEPRLTARDHAAYQAAQEGAQKGVQNGAGQSANQRHPEAPRAFSIPR